MKPKTVLFTAALASLALWGAVALGEGDKPRIEQLNVGKHWFGPEIDVEGLKGKVVLVELWGS